MPSYPSPGESGVRSGGEPRSRAPSQASTASNLTSRSHSISPPHPSSLPRPRPPPPHPAPPSSATRSAFGAFALPMPVNMAPPGQPLFNLGRFRRPSATSAAPPPTAPSRSARAPPSAAWTPQVSNVVMSPDQQPPPYSRRAPPPPRQNQPTASDLYGDMADLLLHDASNSSSAETATTSSYAPSSRKSHERLKASPAPPPAKGGIKQFLKRSFSTPSSTPSRPSDRTVIPVLTKQPPPSAARRPSKASLASSTTSGSSSHHRRQRQRTSTVPFPTLGDDPTWRSCPLPEPSPTGVREALPGVPYARARLPSGGATAASPPRSGSVGSRSSSAGRHDGYIPAERGGMGRETRSSASAARAATPPSRWSSSDESSGSTLHIVAPRRHHNHHQTPPRTSSLTYASGRPPPSNASRSPRPPRSPSHAQHRDSIASSSFRSSGSSSDADSILREGPATIATAAKVSFSSTRRHSQTPSISASGGHRTSSASLIEARRRETERLLELGAQQTRFERAQLEKSSRTSRSSSRSSSVAGGRSGREEEGEGGQRSRTGSAASLKAAATEWIRKRTGSGGSVRMAASAGERRPFWAN